MSWRDIVVMLVGLAAICVGVNYVRNSTAAFIVGAIGVLVILALVLNKTRSENDSKP